MQPVIRPPSTVWTLVLATGGLYFLYWVWRVTSELNAVEQRPLFFPTTWLVLLAVFLALTILSAQAAFESGALFPLSALILVSVSLISYPLVTLGNYIQAKDRQLGAGIEHSNFLCVALFWFAANFGVWLLQRALNRIIKHERWVA